MGKSKASVSYNGKTVAIVSRTDVFKLRNALNIKMSELKQHLIMRMCAIGEESVKIAREAGSYQDRTGNLRSSIGYVVLDDGKPVKYGQQKVYKGKKGSGEKGVQQGKALLEQLQTKYPWGIVLIVCAGMNYAVYVEALYHKDVLTSAELKLESLARQLVSDLELDK